MGKLDTTNPFNKGVSYKSFLENIKGKVTIESLCKKHKLDEDKINWIKSEIKQYKLNNK